MTVQLDPGSIEGMSSEVHRSQLGDFLKARRGEISPEDVGLAAAGPNRRVRGLRREEVAAMASISPDYYARIEQGRRTAPWDTLDAIARVLRLNADEREYLRELSTTTTTARSRRRTQTVTPHFRRLLDDFTTIPAMILGRRMDILAWNPLAAALLIDFSTIPERHRNYVRLTFTHPELRNLNPHWTQAARECVAQLHMDAARDPQDPRLAELVGELSVIDNDFRRWWSDHQVTVRSRGTKEFHHPTAGDLTLDWDTLTSSSDPDLQLITWSAAPDSPSHRKLQNLARARDPGHIS